MPKALLSKSPTPKWKLLYEGALQDRPETLLFAIQIASLTMSQRLHALSCEATGERRDILIALSDLYVLRMSAESRFRHAAE